MLKGGTRNRADTETQVTPLVSIITVVYNGSKKLEDTILSVKEHYSDDIEYIVIDGGSNDDTIEIIQKHDTWINYWASEPDKGIYDALNKGITAARGFYFFCLNVGDRLLEFPRMELLDAKAGTADVVMFDVLLSSGVIFCSKIGRRIRFGNTIHHQGAFYRRALNITYDLKFPVFSDFNTNQLLFQQKKRFLKFNKVISYHATDGISHDKKHLREYLQVVRNNYGLTYMVIGFFYAKLAEFRIRVRDLRKVSTFVS